MAIPRAFIEELLGRTALADLIGRRVKLVRRGREHTGLCPFHNEKTPSFTVNEEKGFYHCFGCGAHGTAIDFLINTENLPFPEAVERLAGLAGMEVPRTAPRDEAAESRRRGLFDVLELAAGWFESQLAGMQGSAARGYLDQRGVDPGVAGTFRLGLAPDSRVALKQAMLARDVTEAQLIEAGLLIKPEDGGETYDRFRNRLMFPIWDPRERVVAFGGRALGDQRAKYLNSPETNLFHKGSMLYNLPAARAAARESGTVIVTEGYMDVIALHQAGLSHAVAPLGTALTEEQIALLWRLTPEPVLCFDGDVAGQRAAYRAAERVLPLLKPGHSLRFALLPPGEDPDSLIRAEGPQAMTTLIDSAQPLAEVLWRHAVEGRSLDTPERRAGLRQDLRELVGRIGDGTVKAYYGEDIRARLDGLTAQRPAGRAAGLAGRRAGGGRFDSDRRGGRQARPGGYRLAPHEGLGSGVQPLRDFGEPNLIAALLNHPELVHAVFEELSALRLRSGELDKIRGEIIKSAVSGAPLDPDDLKTNFSDSRIIGLIEELTGPGNAKLDPFARPDATFAAALEGWTSVFHLHRLSELHREVKDAEARLEAEMTDENWTHLQAAKAALAEAEAAGAGAQRSPMALSPQRTRG